MLENVQALLRSYPTYEEWKRGTNEPFWVQTENGSYPTYEEWKLYTRSFQIQHYTAFLSYL